MSCFDWSIHYRSTDLFLEIQLLCIRLSSLTIKVCQLASEMNFKTVIALGCLLSSSIVHAHMVEAYFRPQFAADQINGTIFKRKLDFSLLEETLQLRCAFDCLNEDGCSGFYVEDGVVCVFGLTSNAEEFEGALVSPASNQIVKAKCKLYFYFFVLF